MPSVFGLPLAMASLFTLGCILIQRAGTRADAVTEGLGVVFLLCALLNAIALLAFLAGTHTPGPVVSRAMSAW
jgi:membrane associated rhomboid family serine protease